MDEIAHLVALHRGLPRQGPGHTSSTLRALDACRGLPPAPEILDIGCGSGAQTLDLARATGGRVTAVDLFRPFLDDLDAACARETPAVDVRTVQADMTDLPFDDGAFDLVWSEGAIYNMGFDAGLAAWRRLLRPGGFLVASEMSWLVDDPPDEVAAYWSAAYPGMRSAEANRAAASGLGYDVLASFVLPEAGWQAYYGPLEARLETYGAEHAKDPVAQEVVATTRAEMALTRRSLAACSYVFYVLRRQ
jgi:SAM-dependent methyltransferase